MYSASSLTQPSRADPRVCLPGHAEEVEARDVRDAAPMAEAAVGIKHGKIDPRVVRPVARRPDHRVDLELAAVGEADRAPRCIYDPRPQLDSVVALELARAGADQSLPMLQPATEP
jgi:hypothetical protein